MQTKCALKSLSSYISLLNSRTKTVFVAILRLNNPDLKAEPPWTSISYFEAHDTYSLPKETETNISVLKLLLIRLPASPPSDKAPKKHVTPEAALKKCALSQKNGETSFHRSGTGTL